MGSDKEVDYGILDQGRETITIQASKKLSSFNKPCVFSDSCTDNSIVNIQPYKDSNFEFVRSNLSKATQAVTDKVDSTIQTNWSRRKNFSVQYEPRTSSEEDTTQKLNSPEIINFLGNVINRYFKLIRL